MLEILRDLNKEVGIKGSMVVTNDGIVAASAVGNTLEDEVVAAVASSVIKAANKLLKSSKLEKLKKIVLNAKYGKLLFIKIMDNYLVIVANKEINLEFTQIAIDGIAYKLKNKMKIKF